MAASLTSQPPAQRIGGGPTRSVAAASWTALGALMLRDLVVLRKHLREFVLRTIIQPFLLCFVFLYVFIWIRATLPRLRYDQLMSFGWKILLPAATINAVVTALVVVAF